MSDFRAISGVTKSLGAFLKNKTGIDVETSKSPSADIADLVPLIHIYLYRVEHNPFWTNNDEVVSSSNVLKTQPVGLNLFYLITPYGNGQLDIQVTLGEVIRVLNDIPSIPSAFYDASLTDMVEELKVIPHMLTLDQVTELSRVFGQRNYRLCITYEVSVVLVDSTVTRNVTRGEERYVDVRQLR